MLDRLSLSLATLPESTYSTILILSDADGSRAESRNLLMANRTLLAHVIRALTPGGCLRSQDGTFPLPGSLEMKEAVLAGLVVPRQDGEDGRTVLGMVKPDQEASQAVPLRLGQRKNQAVSKGGMNGASAAQTERDKTSTSTVFMNANAKTLNGTATSGKQLPAGVGYIDFSDDLDETPAQEAAASGSDDELIDEDTLLSEIDFSRPVVQRMLPRTFIICAISQSANLPTYARIYSAIMPASRRYQQKAPSCLQRLHVRSSPAARSRRPSQACLRRPEPRQTTSRRADRG